MTVQTGITGLNQPYIVLRFAVGRDAPVFVHRTFARVVPGQYQIDIAPVTVAQKPQVARTRDDVVFGVI